MAKVLFLCYYFPPMGMGGTQRSTKFVKYLPAFGWQPVVVTVTDVIYYAQDYSLLDELRHTRIIRTGSLDPLRLWQKLFRSEKPQSTSATSSRFWGSLWNHLNKLLTSWIFIPDSKILWLPFALFASIKLIAQEKIKVIYTTSPPHSAQLGGMMLKLLTGARWVADFRDDWTGGESQPCPTIFHSCLNRLLEKCVLKFADRVIGMCDFLTESLRRKSGYASFKEKFFTLMNGYDAEDFAGLLDLKPHSTFTITHSGSISQVSDPQLFLKAIHSLFEQQPALQKQIRIQFFGSDIFGNLPQAIEKYCLEKIIFPATYLPHRQVLEEIMKSHLLLLIIHKQSAEEIITGKVFEYLASGKPILLLSEEGTVARLLQKLERGTVVRNDDSDAIQQAVLSYFRLFKKGGLNFSPALALRQYERKAQTEQLAGTFFELLDRN